MHYVGTTDQLIPMGNSIRYYTTVQEHFAQNTNRTMDDFYKLFFITGMQHCQGGFGVNSFGQSGSTPPLQNDTQHDALLALIQWREAGAAPTQIIATKFNNDKVSNGVNMTRPVCPYPADAKYSGSGSIWEASNWHC